MKLWLIIVLFLPILVFAEKGLSMSDIEEMKNWGYSELEILKEVKKNGIAFKINKEAFSKLRDLNFSLRFCKALRNMKTKVKFPPLPKKLLKMATNSKTKNVWALVVGVNSYKFLPDLNYAVSDALNFAKHLLKVGVPAKQICLLTEKQVTKTNISRMLQLLVQVKGDIYIFYSGHGLFSPQSGFYFSCFNTPRKNIQENAYPMVEFKKMLESMKCKRAIVFLDACHSGGKDADIEFGEEEKKDRIEVGQVSKDAHNKVKDLRSSNKKIALITSCRANQISLERDGNGLFTGALLEALSGKADENKDGRVNADEAFFYVNRTVARKSRFRQMPDFSVSNSWTEDKGLPLAKKTYKKPPLKKLTITPKFVVLKVGQSVKFRSQVPIKDIKHIKWHATGGNITNSGVYSAGQHWGTYSVKATFGNLSATAKIEIKRSGIKRLVISPVNITIKPNQTVNFSVSAYDYSNNLVPHTPVWQAGGGSINSHGFFRAGNYPGKFRVVAQAKEGEGKAEAHITIVKPKPKGSIQILKWDKGKLFDFRPKAKVSIKVSGNASHVKIIGISSRGREQQLAGSNCSNGQTLHFKFRYITLNTPTFEIRLYDSNGNIIAKSRR